MFSIFLFKSEKFQGNIFGFKWAKEQNLKVKFHISDCNTFSVQKSKIRYWKDGLEMSPFFL